MQSRYRNAVRFINSHVTTVGRRDSNAAVEVLVTIPSIDGNVVLDARAPTRITSLTKIGGKSARPVVRPPAISPARKPMGTLQAHVASQVAKMALAVRKSGEGPVHDGFAG